MMRSRADSTTPIRFSTCAFQNDPAPKTDDTHHFGHHRQGIRHMLEKEPHLGEIEATPFLGSQRQARRLALTHLQEGPVEVDGLLVATTAESYGSAAKTVLLLNPVTFSSGGSACAARDPSAVDADLLHVLYLHLVA